MTDIFHTLIYQPLYNLVVLFYANLPIQDFGLAIILTTLVIKAAFFSLSRSKFSLWMLGRVSSRGSCVRIPELWSWSERTHVVSGRTHSLQMPCPSQ